ncbi:MAG TPA: CRISPR-associated helicase Cas3' [Deltaproteobacteria bacterium]|nr:CRISPR-associated helicase Cas3' [Deltaproteobacteria bacterium]
MELMSYEATEHFWGKLDPREDPSTWHPLEDHCLDVAHCVRALLEVSGIRSRLAELAGVGDLRAAQRDRLAVVAGLHDLGKYNTGFQARISPSAGGARVGHVEEIAQLLSTPMVPECGAIEEAIRLETLEGWFGGMDGALDLLWAALAHHGGPVGTTAEPGVAGLWRSDPVGRDPLAGIEGLVRALERSFPAAFGDSVEALEAATGFQHAFAGLVMLADWIGSDTRFFPYAEPGDAPRGETSGARAVQALRAIGLDPGDLRAAARRAGGTPRAWFGFEHPRPVQGLIAELPLPAPRAGSLVVLEAETGSGKTEAAWGWFARLLAAGAVDGLYLALPTRAAATQIHGRLVEHKRRWEQGGALPALVLAVPGYLRVKADAVEGTRSLSSFEVLWDDGASPAHTRRWAAEGAKRYLAAALAVGTIDQVLLSALRVKHAHLRAFALLRHLLIVDEVHASDPYMERILTEVLRHHLAAGGHALVMSATLGATLRDRLEGLVGDAVAGTTVEAAIATPYPRVSFRYLDGVQGARTAERTVAAKQVRVDAELLADEAASIVGAALAAARQGARVLIIRNTVGGCLAVQEALEQAAGAEDLPLLFRCAGQLAPHHSRYAPEDRRLLDQAVEASFGKDSRAGCVLCATQTVEQSLDIDADLMLTDLCPIDVLLQRIGRLHRHGRGRPVGFAEPRCRILAPGQPLVELIGRGRHGWGSVYQDLRMLQATLDLVAERPVWAIPEDNRLLVERGTHPDALQTACPGGIWDGHVAQLIGTRLGQRRAARDVLVPWDRGFSSGLEPFPRRSEEQIQTRLGGDDLRLVLPQPQSSPFGAQVRELRIGTYLLTDAQQAVLLGDHEPQVLDRVPIRVALPGLEVVYDRLGVRVG